MIEWPSRLTCAGSTPAAVKATAASAVTLGSLPPCLPGKPQSSCCCPHSQLTAFPAETEAGGGRDRTEQTAQQDDHQQRRDEIALHRETSGLGPAGRTTPLAAGSIGTGHNRAYTYSLLALEAVRTRQWWAIWLRHQQWRYSCSTAPDLHRCSPLWTGPQHHGPAPIASSSIHLFGHQPPGLR